MDRNTELARPVRTGLDESKTVKLSVITKVDKLDEVVHGKTIGEHVKEFGVLFSLICVVIMGFLVHKNGSLTALTTASAGALIFALGGYFAPKALHPIWKGWMYFAERLGIAMTAVLLTTVWTFVLTPIALLLKLFRIQVMDMKFRDAKQESYWHDKPAKKNDPELFVQQF